MTIQERFQTLRDTLGAQRAKAAERRRPSGPPPPARQPPHWVLWGLLFCVAAAMFMNLLAAFNGSLLAAVFSGWTAIVVARLWRALGAGGALGDR